MNTPLETFFGGHILLINLLRRRDRYESAMAQFRKHGITTATIIRGVDRPLDHNGQPNGNLGCVMSHRRALDLIVDRKWPRTLVLEDDFDILHEDFQYKFDLIVRSLDAIAGARGAAGQVHYWDLFYLGGGYAEAPIERWGPFIIRSAGMMTTSSYGITWQMAARMREKIQGVGPIDSLFQGFARDNVCLVTQPRLIVQYPNVSDLQDRHMDNAQSMLDDRHEKLV